MIGQYGEGGLYTSHGLMTPADLEEWRRDTDWYEAHPRPQQDDECGHGRYLDDDCDACGRPDDEVSPSGCLRRLVPLAWTIAALALIVAYVLVSRGRM